MNYRLMIERFCLECKDDDIFAVSICERAFCPLWEGRPNQRLQGKQEEDYDDVELADQVSEQLNINSLQRMLHAKR